VSRADPGLHHDIQRATEAIQQYPDNVELYARRAHYYRLAGQLEDSLNDLLVGRDLAPDNLSVSLGLGMTYSAMGRDIEAKAELDRFIRTGGGMVRAFAERAAIHARNDRIQEAIEDYTRAIELRRDVEFYLNRGALQERHGDLDAAARGYLDGFQNLGGAVLLRLALIRVETARGNYDSALALIEPELNRVRVKTNWYLRKAEVLEAAGRTAEANLTLGQALAEANQVMEKRATGIHLFSRAQLYAAMGRTAEAKQDLEQVLLKSPRFAEARQLMEQLEAQGTTQED
jgi:tetratricopeptide (TPR) repeat protein